MRKNLDQKKKKLDLLSISSSNNLLLKVNVESINVVSVYAPKRRKEREMPIHAFNSPYQLPNSHLYFQQKIKMIINPKFNNLTAGWGPWGQGHTV